MTANQSTQQAHSEALSDDQSATSSTDTKERSTKRERWSQKLPHDIDALDRLTKIVKRKSIAMMLVSVLLVLPAFCVGMLVSVYTFVFKIVFAGPAEIFDWIAVVLAVVLMVMAFWWSRISSRYMDNLLDQREVIAREKESVQEKASW